MEYAKELFPQLDLSKSSAKNMPLAARMRPQELCEIVGQNHLLGQDQDLDRILKTDCFSSLIFYGPPGTGKTTLANLIAHQTKRRFIGLSAVSSSTREIRNLINDAHHWQSRGQRTLLFIDEIHRFNKAQQDLLLPHIEEGTIGFMGATTHNPFFALISPLVSRSQIFRLKVLSQDEIVQILERALQDQERGLGCVVVELEEGFLSHLSERTEGDARRALNSLELIVLSSPEKNGKRNCTLSHIDTLLREKPIRYDKDEDEHYDTISAFIKSVRGSDPDAALYWLAKMIYAGEDILFIVRRLVILASEDIGNADPQALTLAISTLRAVEFIGLPESRIPLSQLSIYLACAPKSNASYLAIKEALKEIDSGQTQAVPATLKNVKPNDEKDEHYIYPHVQNDGEQAYLSESKTFVHLKESGFEAEMKRRHEAWLASRKKKNVNDLKK